MRLLEDGIEEGNWTGTFVTFPLSKLNSISEVLQPKVLPWLLDRDRPAIPIPQELETARYSVFEKEIKGHHAAHGGFVAVCFLEANRFCFSRAQGQLGL